ncbi:MAG: hypothetical protein V4653_18425 [Pseudomonadota bacterium]
MTKTVNTPLPRRALADAAMISATRAFGLDPAKLHLWRADDARISCRSVAAISGVDALDVLPLGRLGNHVIALANAIAVAQRYGIGAIHIHRLALGAEFGTPAALSAGGVTLHDRLPMAQEYATLLHARFFFLWSFRGSGGPPFRRALIDGADYPAILQGPVRLLLPRLRSDAVAPSALVMHIRSGDIFGPAPRADYGQPPLAHYLASLDHARALEPVPEVVVVYEDRANPVVDALETALRERGQAYRMASWSLLDDASVLFSARRLVAGFGTFVPSVASLSGEVSDLYFFRGVESAGFFRSEATRLWRVEDVAAGFTPANAWCNSPAQRQAMVNYPVGALGITCANAAKPRG